MKVVVDSDMVEKEEEDHKVECNQMQFSNLSNPQNR
jgi:hypothetical protein